MRKIARIPIARDWTGQPYFGPAPKPPVPARGVRLTDLPKWKAERAAAPDAYRQRKVNRKWGAA